MHVRRWLPIPLALLAIAATGCGDEKTAKDVAEGTTAATTTAPPATTTAPATDGETDDSAATKAMVDKIADSVGTDLKKAPKIIKATGTPPATLVGKDIVKGDGATAKLDDNIKVRYTLVVWDGEKADSSWDRGDEPIAFPLTEGGLIEGWTEGVPGMKVGGRRLLVVPPDQGYGAQGSGAAVPPDSTLVFVVDLVEIEKS